MCMDSTHQMTLSNAANDDEPPATSSKSSSSSNRAAVSLFRPAPRSEWTLLVQGAEARVWKLSGSDNNSTEQQWMVCKERFSKAYRHPVLDERLTKSRCRSEAKHLEKCHKNTTKNLGIRVPKVLRVEPPLLYLEFFFWL